MTKVLVELLAKGWDASDGCKRVTGVVLVVAALLGRSRNLVNEEQMGLVLGAGLTLLGVGALHGGHKAREKRKEQDDAN